MNLSSLVEEFATLGVTVAQTPEGKLFATPSRLLTDAMRARLRAAKAEAVSLTSVGAVGKENAGPEPQSGETADPRGLDLLPVDAVAMSAHPLDDAQEDPPQLRIVTSCPSVQGTYGWRDGEWIGPGIEALLRGSCATCGWAGVPLVIGGEESRCALCWQADQRPEQQPLTCGTFCGDGQTLLLRPSRFEPGGSLACPDCARRMVAIKERAEGTTKGTST